jgi:hypothetical protein
MLWASLWVMTVTDKLANECLCNDVGDDTAQDFASETTPPDALTA